jgi:rhamnogalacturonyl hydrolase YesR
MRIFETRFSFAFKAAVLALAAACVPPASVAQISQSLTPVEIAGITKDTSRHFGDAPANPGPRARDLSTSIQPAAVRRAMRKVADWQMAQSKPYFARIWTWSALYSGLMAASDSLHDPGYRNALEAMGQKYHWELRSAVPNADDQSVGQTYLELYLRDRRPEQLQPTQQALDGLLGGAAARIPANQAQIPWWWCDALFMAPPVWSRMYAATGDKKYLAYLDEHWWQTSKLLYDTHRHLYYRDITFLHAKGPDGQPVYWSRGNGWVMAGIARVLETLPNDEPNRPKYEQQLREMAAAVAKLQDPKDGLWHSNLLDARDYPLPETSGSALMTFALAWGVNHGILSRAEYTPVIARAWAGLVHLIYADGRLGCIQQTGAATAHYLPSSSYTYGVGAFLLAGSQIVDLPAHPHASSPHPHGAKH